MFFQQVLNGLVAGSTYAAVAMGLTLIFGVMRIPNFAHGTIYMVGAYFTYCLVNLLGYHLFISICLAIILVAMLGFLIERIVFRSVGDRSITMDTFIIALGLWIIMENGALYIWGPETQIIGTSYGNEVLVFWGLTITINRTIIFIASTLTVLLIYFFVETTKFGKAMQAVAEDRIAAALVGISPNRVMMFTFAIGSGLAALAGGLVGSSFSISPRMGDMLILKAFCAIVLGGMGNVGGTVLASFILGLCESLGAAYISSAYKDGFAFLILMAVLVFRPHGLFGRTEGEE